MVFGVPKPLGAAEFAAAPNVGWLVVALNIPEPVVVAGEPNSPGVTVLDEVPKADVVVVEVGKTGAAVLAGVPNAGGAVVEGVPKTGIALPKAGICPEVPDPEAVVVGVFAPKEKTGFTLEVDDEPKEKVEFVGVAVEFTFVPNAITAVVCVGVFPKAKVAPVVAALAPKKDWVLDDGVLPKDEIC